MERLRLCRVVFNFTSWFLRASRCVFKFGNDKSTHTTILVLTFQKLYPKQTISSNDSSWFKSKTCILFDRKGKYFLLSLKAF